jgi:uridylate kinase
MVNDDECRAAGIDIKKVESMARRLRRLSREMNELGIVLFGGSGSGSLRFDDGSGKGRLVIAEVGTTAFDGGDGAIALDGAGLLRGE